MPDLLNKQAIVNLLIDSPLREPIKINLIDIVNNTSEPDLPKVYSTITKELEIFQKATERRMKLADETIAKLSGVTPATPAAPVASPAPTMPTPPVTPPTPVVSPVEMPTAQPAATPEPASRLTVPTLDLPPMPTSSISATTAETDTAPVVPTTPPPAPAAPAFQPLGAAPMTSTTDEDALAEIQKELDSLKTEAAADVAASAAPAAPATQPVQQ